MNSRQIYLNKYTKASAATFPMGGKPEKGYTIDTLFNSYYLTHSPSVIIYIHRPIYKLTNNTLNNVSDILK